MKLLKMLLLFFSVSISISANASQSTSHMLKHCHCYQNATDLFNAVEQQYSYYFPPDNRVIFYYSGGSTPVYQDVEKTQETGGTTPKTTMIYRCYNNYQSCLVTWEDKDFYYMYQGNWYYFDSIVNSLKYFGAR